MSIKRSKGKVGSKKRTRKAVKGNVDAKCKRKLFQTFNVPAYTSKLSQILKLIEKGLSIRQTAKVVGLSKSTVHRLLSLSQSQNNEDTNKQPR